MNIGDVWLNATALKLATNDVWVSAKMARSFCLVVNEKGVAHESPRCLKRAAEIGAVRVEDGRYNLWDLIRECNIR